MSDSHRAYTVFPENGADDMDEDDPKVTGGQDAYEFLEGVKTPRRLPAIPEMDDDA